ncbi:MAG: protein BatD [Legionellales bacterium]|nr:protein BatD [Legionellales bacterium]
MIYFARSQTHHRWLCILAMLFFLFGAAIAEATVTASIDKPTLMLGDTFQLSVYGEGLSNNAVPDLSQVVNDFELISSNQTQQVAMVNNRMTSQTVWMFVLAPKHVGTMNIPAISIGTQQTAPLTIKVTDPAKSQSNNAAASDNSQPTPTTPQAVDTKPNIFIKAELSPSSPYVQSEAIYTLRLFYNKQIINPQMGIPSAEGANFIRIGDNRIYQKTIDNHSYQVIEMKYAVFPEKDGILSIKGPEFSGDVTLNDDQNLFIGGTKPIHAQSNTVMINVKPIPDSAHDTWWLPAEDVQISEKWSSNLDNVQAGVPITRTITLAAKGTTASQLPVLISANLPGFQVYPDKPTLTSSSDGETVFGTRIERAAYIPSESGSVTIPAVKIEWWNTRTNQLETAILPAKTMTVIKGSGTAEQTDTPKSTVSNQQLQSANMMPMTQSLLAYVQKATTWFWIALVLVMIWVVTIIGFLIDKKKSDDKNRQMMKSPASDSIKEGEESLKKLKAQMDRAVKAHDPLQFSTALIALARHTWPETEILSLRDIVKKCQTVAAQEAILGLDELRYSYSSTGWQADVTWKVIAKELVKASHDTKSDDDVLPKLYP